MIPPPVISMTWPQYKARVCCVDGRILVRLSPQQTELLLMLMLRYPRAVALSDLVEMLWPDAEEEPEAPIDACRQQFDKLRRRIGSGCITTDYGFGYRLAPRKLAA